MTVEPVKLYSWFNVSPDLIGSSVKLIARDLGRRRVSFTGQLFDYEVNPGTQPRINLPQDGYGQLDPSARSMLRLGEPNLECACGEMNVTTFLLGRGWWEASPRDSVYSGAFTLARSETASMPKAEYDEQLLLNQSRYAAGSSVPEISALATAGVIGGAMTCIPDAGVVVASQLISGEALFLTGIGLLTVDAVALAARSGYRSEQFDLRHGTLDSGSTIAEPVVSLALPFVAAVASGIGTHLAKPYVAAAYEAVKALF